MVRCQCKGGRPRGTPCGQLQGIATALTQRSLSPSLSTQLIVRLVGCPYKRTRNERCALRLVSPRKRFDSERSGFSGQLDLRALPLRREMNGKADLCRRTRFFYIAGGPPAAQYGVD